METVNNEHMHDKSIFFFSSSIWLSFRNEMWDGECIYLCIHLIRSQNITSESESKENFYQNRLPSFWEGIIEVPSLHSSHIRTKFDWNAHAVYTAKHISQRGKHRILQKDRDRVDTLNFIMGTAYAPRDVWYINQKKYTHKFNSIIYAIFGNCCMHVCRMKIHHISIHIAPWQLSWAFIITR